MDTGQGIVLIGEAANRWVTLEWVKFFFGVGFCIFSIVIIILFIVAAGIAKKNEDSNYYD